MDFDSSKAEHPDFGAEISRVAMKDGKGDMIFYKRGNMIYFVQDEKIVEQIHTDDVEVLMTAFMSLI